jgi:hypothetical protein
MQHAILGLAYRAAVDEENAVLLADPGLLGVPECEHLILLCCCQPLRAVAGLVVRRRGARVLAVVPLGAYVLLEEGRAGSIDNNANAGARARWRLVKWKVCAQLGWPA